ncbi:MAG: YifB family Mg chelatase-like AAA ATPase, partial [Cyanobacteria bacterium]|nr:YifB family Mg chelatase-like AAA ATPase [Cyanobacteriota bacterium]
RALEIAAAGGHNMLMVGPPGSGKSLLSKSFPSILPPLSFEEMLEVSRIYSVSGLLNKDKSLVDERPFRSPHHSASPAGITGGGGNPRPGEMTLAHRGVLFLDELVEFPRAVLEVLRQPLENGDITISRAQQSVTFPAKFLFLSAMNPCPCGYKGDAGRTCTCSEVQIQRYVSKLSGPLLDRIDIHIEVPRLSSEELLPFNGKNQDSATLTLVETSETIRNRVIQAREIQAQRFQGTSVLCNGEMTPVHIKQFCQMDGPSQELLKRAVQRMNLSARSLDRILKLARTIADLAIVAEASGKTVSPPGGSKNLVSPQNLEIQSHHLAEALQYRTMERLYQKSLQPV